MGLTKENLYECEHPDYSNLGLPQKQVDELVGELTGCIYCNSAYDREDDEYYPYGPTITFEQLLDDIGFSEEEKGKIYENAKCPNCGCDLEPDSEVTINEYYKEERKYKEYINKITEEIKPKIEEFYDYLINYPFLGYKHDIGIEIANGIKDLNIVSLKNQTYYRARFPDGGNIFLQDNMLPPNPENISITEGRFNHYGQSHWYLGDSKELCGAECTHLKDNALWFQEVKIIKADNILDLTEEYISTFYNPENQYNLSVTVAALLLSGILTKPQKIKGSWKPEYFLTRFIADICKEQGINGIIYPSSVYLSGKNLVIFDISKIEYNFIDDPKLEIYKKREPLEDLFNDLNF